MIILISGASHTGKTFLAQKLLEKLKMPYLSIDHLKMGLIRSGNTSLTPYDDDKLTPYLWDIVKQMICTAIENRQSLIVEGCYIPFDYKTHFTDEYLKDIKYICLVMSESYIKNHFAEIINNENVIEKRLVPDFDMQTALVENSNYLKGCKEHNCRFYYINDKYDITEILNAVFDN